VGWVDGREARAEGAGAKECRYSKSVNKRAKLANVQLSYRANVWLLWMDELPDTRESEDDVAFTTLEPARSAAATLVKHRLFERP
jgi:hypothetical protein